MKKLAFKMYLKKGAADAYEKRHKQIWPELKSLLKSSGMKLNQYHFQPSTEDLHRNGKNFPPNYLHKSWMDYLYWDVELEA